jgi:uncharacterized Zn-finger protein
VCERRTVNMDMDRKIPDYNEPEIWIPVNCPHCSALFELPLEDWLEIEDEGMIVCGVCEEQFDISQHLKDAVAI